MTDMLSLIEVSLEFGKLYLTDYLFHMDLRGPADAVKWKTEKTSMSMWDSYFCKNYNKKLRCTLQSSI